MRSKHHRAVLNGEQVIGNLRRPSGHLGPTNRVHDLPACRIAFARCVSARVPQNLQNLLRGLVLTPGRRYGIFTNGRTSTCNFLLRFCKLSKWPTFILQWHADGSGDPFHPGAGQVWLALAFLSGCWRQASSVALWCPY